jgi:hypothetical protein
MGEPLDHRPPGWIRQSRKCCIQLIHNRMVVDFRSMSTANFAILDYCSLISLNPDTRAKLFPAATSATSPMLTGGGGDFFWDLGVDRVWDPAVLRGRREDSRGGGGGYGWHRGSNLVVTPSHPSRQRTPAGDPGCGFTPALPPVRAKNARSGPGSSAELSPPIAQDAARWMGHPAISLGVPRGRRRIACKASSWQAWIPGG